MRISYVVISCALFLITATAQRPVVIPVSAHEQIRGDVYGSGEDGIVLAHGGRFNKESWAPQARVLADAGFTVLAINFRGDRLNPDGTPSARGRTRTMPSMSLPQSTFFAPTGQRQSSPSAAALAAMLSAMPTHS